MHKQVHAITTCCEAVTCTAILSQNSQHALLFSPRETLVVALNSRSLTRNLCLVMMDVSPTSEFTVPASSGISSQLPHVRTSASEPPLGGALARAWPPAPPPKAVATILGGHLGRARPHSPPTDLQHMNRRKSEATGGGAKQPQWFRKLPR